MTLNWTHQFQNMLEKAKMAAAILRPKRLTDTEIIFLTHVVIMPRITYGLTYGIICTSACCIMDDPYGHPWANRWKCPKAQDDFIKKTAYYAAAKEVRVCGAPAGSAVAKAAAEAARAAAARSATDTFQTDLARTRAAVNADADASVVSAASVSTTSSAVRRFSLLDMQRPMRRNERRAAEREAAAAAAAAGMMPAPPAPRQQTGRESKRRLAQKAAEIAANKAAKRYLNQAA
eukprot:tig00001340_g8290.t1